MHPNDGFSDKICLICRTKVQDAFDFKSMVEKSDKLLWLGNTASASGEAPIKKLVFNDISEVKVEIEGCKSENDLDNITEDDDKNVNLDFENCEDKIFYKNTMIRKCIKSEDTEAIHVEDFIKNIKNELPDVEDANEEEYMDDWRDDDDEYFPPGTTSAKSLLEKISGKKRKKQKGWKKPKKLKSNKNYVDEKENNKAKPKMEKLTPVYLEDISLVPTRPRQFPRIRKKRIEKKYTSICPYCGKVCNSYAIKKHLLQHTGEKKYKCTECPAAYFTEKELQKHVKKHTGIKEFKCNDCSADFYDKSSLASHIRSHKETRDCICTVCGKGFKRRCTLLRHLLRHSSANKMIQCEQCNMSFYEKCQLKHHMRIHTGERPFKCEKNTLSRHMLRHSSANKIIKCELCNMSFFEKWQLDHHLRIHTGERPFKCEKDTLVKHMLRHSSANKIIKCELCNMSFFEKWQLDHHLRIHTGERPFKCELCPQPYSYKHDFNRHCFKKHGVFMKRRNIRVMNEEFLREERATIKAALESQHSLEDLRLTSTSGDVFNKGPHIVDAGQLKILFSNC